MLQNFDAIHCGPCPPHFGPPHHTCDYVAWRVSPLPVHYNKALLEGVIEFRSTSGLILISLIYQPKGNAYALVVMPEMEYKIYLPQSEMGS